MNNKLEFPLLILAGVLITGAIITAKNEAQGVQDYWPFLLLLL